MEDRKQRPGNYCIVRQFKLSVISADSRKKICRRYIFTFFLLWKSLVSSVSRFAGDLVRPNIELRNQTKNTESFSFTLMLTNWPPLLDFWFWSDKNNNFRNCKLKCFLKVVLKIAEVLNKYKYLHRIDLFKCYHWDFCELFKLDWRFSTNTGEYQSLSGYQVGYLVGGRTSWFQCDDT